MGERERRGERNDVLPLVKEWQTASDSDVLACISPAIVSDRPDQSDPNRRYTFPKSHRLKRRRLIRSLFDRSRDDVDTVAEGCIRLLYRIVDREAVGYDVPIQVGFAPGRRAESGVERNRIRRLLREVYRVHQHTLVDLFVCDPDRALIVMILFRGNPDEADACIENDLPPAMRQVADRVGAGEERE